MLRPDPFLIDGVWTSPSSPAGGMHSLISPASEIELVKVPLASDADVNAAVAAARKALPAWSRTTVAERIELLERILQGLLRRSEEMARAISDEMGCPITLSRAVQVGSGVGHLMAMMQVLRSFAFEQTIGNAKVYHEPIGVCGLIAPWNWPINQISVKVVPALAAGCTTVLKPSEFAPLSATLWAEILHDAGVPNGVFNLIHGGGNEAGAALTGHPDVDMISFTGSTRAGIEISRNAAATIKRVTLELGGKSPVVIFDEAQLEQAVTSSLDILFANAGQTCTAPSRMLVPSALLDAAGAIATRVAEAVVVGDPAQDATTMGPLVSARQFERVQDYIERGIAEGAELLTGGPGRPSHLNAGYFARPTVFTHVDNAMSIAREEIFGPVLSIIPFDGEEEALEIANDSPYGLAGYVWSSDPDQCDRAARTIRAGIVHVNGGAPTLMEPFGGHKQSGNGREWGEYGLREYLEVKSVVR